MTKNKTFTILNFLEDTEFILGKKILAMEIQWHITINVLKNMRIMFVKNLKTDTI